MNNSSKLDVKALKPRYTYMFAGKNIGLDFYRGWFPILAQVCADDRNAGMLELGRWWME